MIALRVEIENWRWRGVPFYLRSGKSMKASRQVITLGFQEPALRMFHAHRKDVPTGRTNEIVIDFADPGSINIDFMAKMPGPEMTLGASVMSFRYADSFAQSNALEGYERLILLAMLGDHGAVHQLGRHRAGLGDLRAAADVSPAGRAVRARHLGAGQRGQADRPVPLAP